MSASWKKGAEDRIIPIMRETLDKNAFTIELDEAIVLNNGSYYDELAEKLKKGARRHIVLDFSRVDIIDDCGLQAIIRLVERYGRRGYTFTLSNPGRSMLKLLVFRDMVDRIDVRFTEDFRL